MAKDGVVVHGGAAAQTESALTPPGGLVVLVRQVEHVLISMMMRDLDDERLSPERWRIISVLRDDPGQTMTTLMGRAVLPAASLTRHVDFLVGQGLVVRRPDATDGRRVIATLSGEGVQVCDRVRARQAEREERLRSALGAERFDAMVNDLRLIPHLSEI
ncbi:MAG: MarR family winged helix-turn-helix transcriptional regulator [Nostocoides sp.]